VNFWRAKAEEFTGETQEYRDRLAALRREIIERDSLIEKLRDAQIQAGGMAMPTPDGSPAGPAEPSAEVHAEIESLRALLAESERKVDELQSELAAAHDTDYATAPEQSLEIQARIETLSRQVASFDQALNEAHTARAAAKSEVAAARRNLELRAARSRGLAAAERMRASGASSGSSSCRRRSNPRANAPQLSDAVAQARGDLSSSAPRRRSRGARRNSTRSSRLRVRHSPKAIDSRTRPPQRVMPPRCARPEARLLRSARKSGERTLFTSRAGRSRARAVGL
jgi:chromosome segregation ATPase